MIEFILEEEEKGLTFGDVKDDQFFVNIDGWLCQKHSFCKYNCLASPDGILCSVRFWDVPAETPVRKIYPMGKIKFD